MKKKYLTRVETNVGHETYSMTIESEEGVSINDTYYRIKDAFVSEVKQFQNNTNKGPIVAKQFYQELIFPMQGTIVSEQVFEYGGNE